jgi:hypothetical protein
MAMALLVKLNKRGPIFCPSTTLTTAIEFGHGDIARLFLDCRADPGWPELGAAYGASLHAAASAGDRELVELLLARGANPNGDVDSGGNAV